MKNTGNQSEAAILRQKAEKLLKKRPSKTGSQLSETETLKLLHELEVHQIELEMQNEELVLAKEQAADLATEKYAELYDFAPSGYFTLSREGKIIDLNLCGSQMLGKERSRLKNNPFGFYVSNDTKPIFNLFFGKLFNSKAKENCEVTLSTNDNLPTYIYLTGIVTENKEQCLVTAIDITDRKRAEEALRKSLSLIEAILESIHNGILVVSHNGTVIKTNAKFAEMWRVPSAILSSGDDKTLLENVLGQLADPDGFIAKVSELYGKSEAESLDLIYFKDGRVLERISKPMYLVGETKGRVWSFLDITERKQAEENLQISEKKYRNLVENAIVGIYTTNLGGKYLFSNQAMCSILEYDSIDELLNADVRSFYKNKEERVKFIEAIQKSKQIFNYELELITQKGRTIHVLINSFISGEEIKGTMMDISDRKRAEDDLLTLSSRQEAILAAIPDIIMEVDKHKDYTWANHAGFDFFGEDVIGKEADFFFEGEQDTYKTVELLFSGSENVIYLESWQRRKDGEKRLLAWWCRVLKDEDGNVTGALSTARDITEHKQAEEAMKESEEKYRNIVNWAPVGIYQTTRDGKFLSINQRLTEILGYESINDLQRRNIETDIYLTPSERQSVIARFESSGYIFNYELRWKKKNGTPIWISLSVHAIKDKAGITQYFEGFASDITERKRTEEALKESESRFRSIFGESPIVIWEEDFSGVKARFDELRKLGVTDFRYYLNQNPDEVSGLAARVQILEINQQSVKLLGAVNKKQVSRELLRYFTADSLEVFKEEMIALADGKMHFQSEIPILNLQGESLILDLLLAVQPGYEETLSRVLVSTMDITDRKRAEENLRISEKKYRNLVEHAIIGIYSRTLQGKFLFANNAMCKMLEYDSIDEFLTSDIISFYKNKDDNEKLIEMLKKEKHVFNYELELITIKEKTINVLINSFISGEIITGMMMDISDRKRAEEALQESERQYRNLVELLPDGIVVHSEGKVIYANSAAARILSVSIPDDLVGVSAIEFVHPDYREITLNRINMAFKENSATPWMEVIFIKRDGTRINVEIATVPFLIKEKKAMLTVFNDITERKQAEEELKESISLYKLLSENMRDVVWLMDLNLKIIYISPSIEKMRGYTLEEIKQLPLEKHLTPESLQIVMSVFDEEKAKFATITNYLLDRTLELEFYHKDGSTFWLESTFNIIRDKDGLPVSILAEGRDITERRQNQEEIIKLNAELEQRVMDRTMELQAKNKELESFSYSVSHDLRAPLRAIDGFTGILLEDYEPKLDDEGKKLCFRIKENACQMGRLIDDLLSFSRLSHSDINISRINMKELAGSVYTELTTPEMRKQIDFQLNKLDSVSGDLTLLHQVWTNLISNAIKFSVQKERTMIKISCKREKNRIIFSIQDNGAGFDMKYSDKLFGVFQRLHSMKKFGGTGVGLAIVQRIINRHGGEVWAEGEVDKGASFYFSLPI